METRECPTCRRFLDKGAYLRFDWRHKKEGSVCISCKIELSAIKKRERKRVYAKVKKALDRAELTPGPCAVCGKVVSVQPHHEDYSKPLDVIWLCTSCHANWNNEDYIPRPACYDLWLPKTQWMWQIQYRKMQVSWNRLIRLTVAPTPATINTSDK